MAAMTTALTEYANFGNSITYRTDDHTDAAPRLVILDRKTSASPDGNNKFRLRVVFGTEDAEGNPLASKIGFSAEVTRPIPGQAADFAAAKALFLEAIASDEFSNSVDKRDWF
jgi:hypothetical protein